MYFWTFLEANFPLMHSNVNLEVNEIKKALRRKGGLTMKLSLGLTLQGTSAHLALM